ncbi:MAG: HD domain-containing protein [Actinobacteria bacterium]|nr:HD domain-containing protein [Actinomycetota bacterium]
MLRRKLSELVLIKAIVVILGLIILVVFLPFVWMDKLGLAAIFFVACAVIAGLMDVQLPQGGSVSVDGAVVVASIALLPLPKTLLVVTGGTLIAALIKRSWRNSGGIGFVVTSKSVTATAATAVFYLFRGEIGKIDPIGGFPALFAMSTTYFAFEILMDELSKLRRRVPSLSALASSGKFLFPLYLTFSSLGILLALLYGTMGAWSALFFFLPLVVTRHSFKLYMDIRKVYTNTIKALANTIEAQNPDRRGHAERVAEIATGIAREMGLHGKDLELVGYAALLHDIGMIAVDEEAEKSGVDHAAIGAEIIEKVEFVRDASEMVRMHHASYATNGMTFGACIISVASRFDDLTNDMTIERRLNEAQALAKIKRDQSILYDPKVVRALWSFLSKRGILDRNWRLT